MLSDKNNFIENKINYFNLQRSQTIKLYEKKIIFMHFFLKKAILTLGTKKVLRVCLHVGLRIENEESFPLCVVTTIKMNSGMESVGSTKFFNEE